MSDNLFWCPRVSANYVNENGHEQGICQLIKNRGWTLMLVKPAGINRGRNLFKGRGSRINKNSLLSNAKSTQIQDLWASSFFEFCSGVNFRGVLVSVKKEPYL